MYKTSTSAVTVDDEGSRRSWWLLNRDAGPTTDGVLGFAQVDPGIDTAVHRHPHAEEAVLVLEGNGTAVTSGGSQPIAPGAVLYAPRGAWHGLRAGDAGLRLLVAFAGVSDLLDAGLDGPEQELLDLARPASVVDTSGATDHSAHNPAMGFFHIKARWLVDAASVGSDRIVIGQARSAANGGAHELHRHEHAAEFFCLMEGEGVQITAEGDEVPIRAGDTTYVPQGEWHGFRNTGSVETRAIFGFFGVDSREAAGYEVQG
jgi:mannose-6-phosphate isomerase-like protein (cupin superfamily)